VKIFDEKENWTEKVNFVDANNVYLGYDMSQCCCEFADWFIDDTPHVDGMIPDDLPKPRDLESWSFDTAYFLLVENELRFDAGSMAIFRITDGSAEKFIHLFNCHNGYYGHGFDFKVGDTMIQEGGL
jgi:hypothetical protein